MARSSQGNESSAKSHSAASRTSKEVIMETSEAVLDVSGMHCGSCGSLIDETLSDLPGVVSARTDRDSNQSTVRFDAAQVSVADLVSAIGELGYDATPR